MVGIIALREAEPWETANVFFAVVMAIAVLAFLGWLIYRYLGD